MKNLSCKASGQSLLPLLLPRCCEGLALFLRYVLHRKQQRPDRVPVVNRLDEMTKDNLTEAGRISGSAKLNTR